MNNLSNINSKEEAINISLEIVDFLLTKGYHYSHILKVLNDTEEDAINDIDKFDEKIRLYDYDPKDLEVNEQVGRYFMLEAITELRPGFEKLQKQQQEQMTKLMESEIL